jgi:hypothetical protein
MRERPDLEPGFWPNFEEPSPVARAIQMPLYPMERWINGVLNAHIKRKPAGRVILAEASDER